MSDTSDLPYGHRTARFPAMFVRDGSKTSASGPDLQATLGHDPVRLSARFVPEGQSPPGHPYVAIGHAQFRPDPPPEPHPVFTRRPQPRPARPTGDPVPGSEDRPPPPPTPAVAYLQSSPIAAGLAVWRGMANVTGKQRTKAMPGADAADAPSGATTEPLP